MDQIADFNALKSFSIPKRSNLNKEILQVLDPDSREYKDIVQTFNDAARSKPNIQNFSFLKIYHVRNQSMEEEFLERRKFFKTFKDNSAMKVAPAFVCANSLKEAKGICSNGLRVGNSKLSHLGHPEKGVYLCKYSDTIQPQPFINDQCGFIIGVNVIKGRVKFMDENHSGEPLDPTPDFECHLSKSLSKLDKDSSQSVLYETSQIYVYEYDEYLEIQKRPRHIIPIFVIHFRHQSREDRIFKRNHIKKEKWISNNSPRGVPPVIKLDKEDHNILWKGDLYIQGSNITGLSLYSIITFPKPDSFLAQTLEVIESVDIQFCFLNYDGLDKLGRIGFGVPVTMGNKCYHRAEMRVIGPILPIHTNLVALLEKTLKCIVIKLGSNLFLLLLPDCNFVTQNLGYQSESDKCILHGMVVNHIMPIIDFSKEYASSQKEINPIQEQVSKQYPLTSEDEDDEDVDLDIIKLKKHKVSATETTETPHYDPFSDNGDGTTSEDENKLLQKLLSTTGVKVPHFSALSSCTVGRIEKMSMSQDLIDDIVLKQPLKRESINDMLTADRKKTEWSDFEFDAKNDQSDDIIKCMDLKRIKKVRKQKSVIKYSDDKDDDTPISRYYKTKSNKSSLTSDNDEDIRSNYSSSLEDSTKFNYISSIKDEFITKKPRLSSIVMPVNKSTPVESILATAFKNVRGDNSGGSQVELSGFNASSGYSELSTKEEKMPIDGDDAQTLKDVGGSFIQRHLPKFNFGRIWGDRGGVSDQKIFSSSRIDDMDEHILENILGYSPIESVIGNSPMESVGSLEMNISEMTIIPIERTDDKMPDIVEGRVRLSLEYDVILDSMKITIEENELMRKINIDPPNIFVDENEITKLNLDFDVESVCFYDCLTKVIHQRPPTKLTNAATLTFINVNNALHAFKEKPDTRKITFNNDILKICVNENRNDLENKVYKELLGPELFERGKWKIKKTNFIKLFAENTNKHKSIPFLDESDIVPGLNIFSSMSTNKILNKWPIGLRVVDVDPNGFQCKKTGKLPDIVGIEIITVCDPRLSQNLPESSIYYKRCQEFWRRYHQATEEAWLLNEGGKYYVKIDNGAIQLVLKVNPVDSKVETSTPTPKPQKYLNDNKLNADNITSPHKNIFSKKFKKHHKFKEIESETSRIMPISNDIPLPAHKERLLSTVLQKNSEINPFLADISSNKTTDHSPVNIDTKSNIEDKNATDYDSDLEARLAEKERLKAEILLLEQRVKEKKLEKARRLAENPHIKTFDNDDFSFSSDSTNLSECFDNSSIPLIKPSQNMHPLSAKINENTNNHEVIISTIKTEIFDNFNDMLNEITCSSLSVQQPDSTSTFSNDIKLNNLPISNLSHLNVANNDTILIDTIVEDCFLEEAKSCLLSVNTICSTVRECESKMSPDSSNRIENCQEDIKKDLINIVEIKIVEKWSHLDGLSAATQFEGQFCENSYVRDTLLKEIREWLKKKPLEIIALGKSGSINISSTVSQKDYPSLNDLLLLSNTSTLSKIISDAYNEIIIRLNNFVEMCMDGRFVDYIKELDELDIINAQNNDEENFHNSQVLLLNLEVVPDHKDIVDANLNRRKEGEKSSEDFDFMNDRINAEIKSNFEKVHRKIKKRKIKKLKPIHKLLTRSKNSEINVNDNNVDFDIEDANKWLDDNFIEKCILEANQAINSNKNLHGNTQILTNKNQMAEKSALTISSPKMDVNLADVKFTKEFDAVADQILENVYTSRLEREKEKRLQMKEKIRERIENIINDKTSDNIDNKYNINKHADNKDYNIFEPTKYNTFDNNSLVVNQETQFKNTNNFLDNESIAFYSQLFGDGNDMFGVKAKDKFNNTMPHISEMLNIDKCFLWALGLGLFNQGSSEKEPKKIVKNKICKQIVDSYQTQFSEDIEQYFNSWITAPVLINCEDIELPPAISHSNGKVAEKAKIKFAFGSKRKFNVTSEDSFKRKKTTEMMDDMFSSDEEIDTQTSEIKNNLQQDSLESDINKSAISDTNKEIIKPLMELTDLTIKTDNRNLIKKYDKMLQPQPHHRWFDVSRRFDQGGYYRKMSRSRSKPKYKYYRRSRSGDLSRFGDRRRHQRSISSSSSSASSSHKSNEPSNKPKNNEENSGKKRVFRENPDVEDNKLGEKSEDINIQEENVENISVFSNKKQGSKMAPTPFPKFLQKLRHNQLASKKHGNLPLPGEDADQGLDKDLIFSPNIMNKLNDEQMFSTELDISVSKNDIVLDEIELPSMQVFDSCMLNTNDPIEMDLNLKEIILPSIGADIEDNPIIRDNDLFTESQTMSNFILNQLSVVVLPEDIQLPPES